MRTSEIRAIALKEIPEALIKAKLLEGDTLDADQVKSTKAPMFWTLRVSSTVASSKLMFVTWNLIAAEPIGYADNEAAIRRPYVSIEVFTKLSVLDDKVQKLIERIDKALQEKGWSFEMVAAPSWDNENNLNQLSYSATKKL